MKKTLLASVVSMMTLFGAVSIAQADTYVWEDPDYRVTFSHPDRWEPQGGLTDPEIYRLVADGDDNAECTLYTHTDRRFMIYPRRYMDDVMNEKFTKESFWEKHFANVDNLEYGYEHEGGVGHGDARVAMVYFDKTVGENTTRKAAMSFATVYGDQQIVVECEVDAPVFDKYKDTFGSVVGSVEFLPQYKTKKNGMYRDFINGED